MNLKEQNKMQADLDNLTQLFKALCDDVDMMRETLAERFLNPSDKYSIKKDDKRDAKAREVKELENLFANVSKTKKMNKEEKL